MRTIDLSVESKITLTPRVKQLSGMFDAPIAEKLSHRWKGALPIDERDWNIGLIVGPSGAGKSSVARQLFGEHEPFTWTAPSIIDDFDATLSIDEITKACSAVGFNSIPSWAKPYAVLSTGEQFRATVARHLLETPDPIVVDEFTSVVDRQVAQIGSHAVQKIIRKNRRRFVAVTCHYDVIDWLQPDWMLEPATMTFQWRSPQRRPDLDIEIARVTHAAWSLFAPFHYLTNELHKGANCFCLFVNGVPAVFCGVLHRPHAITDNIKGVSRVVTLPDYQGLGLAFVLLEKLGGAYRGIGYRFRNYPAHPAFVRAHDRSPQWMLCKRPGRFSAHPSKTSQLVNRDGKQWNVGGRPCAVFEFVGPVASIAESRALLEGAALPKVA